MHKYIREFIKTLLGNTPRNISQANEVHGQSIWLDYKVNSRPRYSSERPNPRLYEIINRGRERYSASLKDFLKYKDNFTSIDVRRDPGDPEPSWVNGWLPGLDGVSIYSFLANINPDIYLEVGSGNSTKFARKAIRDHNLKTRIISIDPHPRAEIDGLCDKVLRLRLEDVDLEIFDLLKENDILFIDNSHRLFMNSDATVVFMDILPRLNKGVLVEFHDIYLPYDYPEEWIDRYYSEQYGLACYLLAEGTKIQIELPNFFISEDKELSKGLDELWGDERLKEVERHGGSFWIRIL